MPCSRKRPLSLTLTAVQASISRPRHLILADWVAVPTWHSRDFQLVQPYVKGYQLTPIGVPQLQNISIERQQ